MSKVYGYVQERILAMLDAAKENGGMVPWKKTWTGAAGGMPRNGYSGHAYRGINIWLTLAAGFQSPFFYTRRQVKMKGGQIRKGEKGTMVVFFSWHEKKEGGEKTGERYAFLKYYNVWNLEQIDGIEAPTKGKAAERPFSEIESAEQILNDTPVRPETVHGRSAACYVPALDRIEMPNPETFESDAAYYSTRFHELVHATGHDSRLKRDLSGLFGDHSYSKEELIAEMGAAFLCGVAGIEDTTVENSAAYIDSWRRKISQDVRLVVQAGAAAQKAVDRILGREFNDGTKTD